MVGTYDFLDYYYKCIICGKEIREEDFSEEQMCNCFKRLEQHSKEQKSIVDNLINEKGWKDVSQLENGEILERIVKLGGDYKLFLKLYFKTDRILLTVKYGFYIEANSQKLLTKEITNILDAEDLLNKVKLCCQHKLLQLSNKVMEEL